jgi:hypothetical protein
MTQSDGSPAPPPDPLTSVEPAELTLAEQSVAAQPLPAVGQTQTAIRERVRTRVTYAVVAVTLALGGVLTGAYLAQLQNVKLAISGVFTPLLGVAGVIIGFYFGGKDSTS